MASEHRSRGSISWRELASVIGLLVFAAGFFLLVAGGAQRWDGRLSYGGRSGPREVVRREDDPERFARVTTRLIAGGAALVLLGLGTVLAASPSGERPGGPGE